MRFPSRVEGGSGTPRARDPGVAHRAARSAKGEAERGGNVVAGIVSGWGTGGLVDIKVTT